ncbi:hypothetical protein UVI_02015220 [Ustilaginoidea virens]|uniref:Heterokaryon incompatibility domain-containing protein n=1 Tax=Ustilaginoidea virens TaxID=1159556 RepID=A0A1B5KS03_USTVR|nr:hypothetical protein UVI_02015220 [Ustilaginoidea virens]
MAPFITKHLTQPPSIVPGLDATLRVQLLQVDITDGRPTCAYDTLSYVWSVSGGSEPDRPILVESGNQTFQLLIHRPLERALLQFAADDTLKLPIFVDQICIDQRNSKEKEHQVVLMRDIYANCQRVIVWLGPSTPNSTLWFNYATEICSEGVLGGILGPRVASCMTVFDAVMDPSIPLDEQEQRDRDAIIRIIQERGRQFPINGYEDFFDRTWFGRLWTIQEACLAPSLVMKCGSQELCYDCLRAAMLFFSLNNNYWLRHLDGPVHKSSYTQRDMLYDKQSKFSRVIQERKAIHKTGQKRLLYDLILKYNVNDLKEKIAATLGEDRIFGLLGLAEDKDALRQNVHVEYNEKNPAAGAASTYAKIATLMLGQKTDTLLFNQFPKRIMGMPSWVPDWSMDLHIPVCYSTLTEPIFAAGGEGNKVSVDNDFRRLTVGGVLVDRVSHVGTRTYSLNPERRIDGQTNYRDLKTTLDQVEAFVREAATTTIGRLAPPLALDEAAQNQQRLRVFDSGLSHHDFIKEHGRFAGLEKLQATHDFIYNLGKRLLDSDAFAASYSIFRIYRTVGIIPWYFTPPPETDTLTVLACDPVAAARVVVEAGKDIAEDIVGLCLASARVSWATYRIWFRNRYGKMIDLSLDAAKAEKLGLPDNIRERREEVTVLCNNALKNMGRYVYRTWGGYVGMGPSQTKPGDAVVVFHGGTAAHVLRRVEGAQTEVWEYIGEAYCDGVMRGEALDAEAACDFVLV